VAFNLGKMVTIEPEILYTMKGGILDDPIGEYSEKVYGDYLEIPFSSKLNFPCLESNRSFLPDRLLVLN
jgi:hypothetical protein